MTSAGGAERMADSMKQAVGVHARLVKQKEYGSEMIEKNVVVPQNWLCSEKRQLGQGLGKDFEPSRNIDGKTLSSRPMFYDEPIGKGWDI